MKILILSGPTHEYIDPVRFIGNASSGKMGKAIAEVATKRGHYVQLVSGPVPSQNLPQLPDKQIEKVTSAQEMLTASSKHFYQADAIIFAAAVADYAPQKTFKNKLKKSENDLILQLRPTPDIAKLLSTAKRANQITVGFALQTDNGKLFATKKLKQKKLNAIILNQPNSLGAETGTFSFLLANKSAFEHWGSISKTKCAMHIIDAIERM